MSQHFCTCGFLVFFLNTNSHNSGFVLRYRRRQQTHNTCQLDTTPPTYWYCSIFQGWSSSTLQKNIISITFPLIPVSVLCGAHVSKFLLWVVSAVSECHWWTAGTSHGLCLHCMNGWRRTVGKLEKCCTSAVYLPFNSKVELWDSDSWSRCCVETWKRSTKLSGSVCWPQQHIWNSICGKEKDEQEDELGTFWFRTLDTYVCWLLIKAFQHFVGVDGLTSGSIFHL